MPYGYLDFSGALGLSLYRGVISFLSISEPYMPDRCSRQYGRVQDIPRPAITPFKAKRLRQVKTYSLEFDPSSDVWDARGDHCLRIQELGPAVEGDPAECAEGYMDWYTPRTHLHIRPQARD